MQTSIRPELLVVLSVVLLVILSPLVLALAVRPNKRVTGFAALLLGLSAILLTLFAVLLDGILGLSSSWFFTVGVLLLGCGVGWVVHFRYRSGFALVVIGLIAIFALVQHFMDFSPVKPYRRFFAAIEPGMTEADVLGVLDREFPEGFRFPKPVQRDFAQDRMDFFLDPTETAWNAEGIFIHLRDGQVISKEYSRD